jgi:hypothetical protein
LIDLHFTDRKNLKQFDCGQCAEATKKQRKCLDDGFENIKAGKQVDEYGMKYSFCPGKATWFYEILELYRQCRLSYLTGILPRSGGMDEQDAKFAETFPIFIDRWESRKYIKTWSDVNEFTVKVFESIGKMFGSK